MNLSDQESNPRKLPVSNQGLLQKLTLLQIQGSWKSRKSARTSRLYERIPRRLAFRLRDLLSEEKLYRDGIIFLGFLADGQHVVSYTYQLEADEVDIPTYRYWLQWWLFVPYKPLVKVSEIRLFGTYKIASELMIAVCQWPTDQTKILIYGSSVSAPQDNVQCYITVVAVPPLRPCKECTRVRKLSEGQDPSEVNEDVDWDMPKPAVRCLRHSFVIHTIYQLTPPYPSFTPSVCMKRNGVVLINTGDTLVVLDINIHTMCSSQHCGRFCCHKLMASRDTVSFALPQCSEKMSCSVSKCDKCLKLVHSHNSNSIPRTLFSKDRHYCTGHKESCARNSIDTSALSEQAASSRDVKEDLEQTEVCNYCVHIGQSEKHTCLEILGSPECSSRNYSEPDEGDLFLKSEKSDFTSVVVPLTIGGADQTNVVKLGEFDMCSCRTSDQSKDCELLCGYSWEVDGMQKVLEQSDSEQRQVDDDSCQCDPSDCPHEYARVSAKLSRSRLSEVSLNCKRSLEAKLVKCAKTEALSGSESVPESVALKKETNDKFNLLCDDSVKENISPEEKTCPLSKDMTFCQMQSANNVDSGPNGSIVTETRHIFHQEEQDLLTQDDEGSPGFLPLEVHGVSYRCLKSHHVFPSGLGEAVEVRQVTFDVEHYAHVLGQKLCSQKKKVYSAFNDYDVQIVELCPEDSTAVVLVRMLIQATDTVKSESCHVMDRSVYQTGFFFQWNIDTGHYSVLKTEELVKFETSEVHERWNPAQKAVQKVQRECRIFHPKGCGVTVTTNEAVLRGSSLKIIWAPGYQVAITL